MRRTKSPDKLAEIVREGIGPLHTAVSSKKRKAHTALNNLEAIAVNLDKKHQEILRQLSLYESSFNDEMGLLAEEVLTAIGRVLDQK